MTGDLGAIGREIAVDILESKGLAVKGRFDDCALMLYDRRRQDVQAGASGAACSRGSFAPTCTGDCSRAAGGESSWRRPDRCTARRAISKERRSPPSAMPSPGYRDDRPALRSIAPKEAIEPMDYLLAFLVGDRCVRLGQTLYDRTRLTMGHVMVIFVVAGALLTAFGLYEPLIRVGGQVPPFPSPTSALS